VLLLAAALLVFIWLTNVVAQWGDRNWVFLSISAAVLASLALFLWLLALAVPLLYRLAVSLGKSMAPAVAADPEVRRISARYPRFAGWLGRRLSRGTWRGLYLTVTVLLGGYFFAGFLSIARAVATSGLITRYDVQISALLRAFRTPQLTRAFWAFTVLGDFRVAWALAAVTASLLLIWGRKREAVMLAAAVGGATLLGEIAKQLFERPRPDATFALVRTPSSYSFPSEHALYAVCFWGVIGFLAVRSTLTKPQKVTAVLFATSAIMGTALSRVYLGVHWASDVAASWVLGLGWLSVCIGVYLMWMRYTAPPAEHPTLPLRTRWTITTLGTLLAASALIWSTQTDPILGRLVAAPPTRHWDISIDASGAQAPTPAQMAQLPRFSEKPDGTPQEPIGIIFIGSEELLTARFRQAGWAIADPPTPGTLLHAAAAAISNTPYATAPVTPTFLDGNVQTLAFEKPEGRATVRRRHHSRWWRTNFVVQGSPVWVATASFDSRLEIGSAVPLPTHHIDPNIDAEQRYVVRDLTRVGLTALAAVRVSPPATGTDAQGDPWFTQGMATILVP